MIHKNKFSSSCVASQESGTGSQMKQQNVDNSNADLNLSALS